jgi:tetratricopeptide (TPR) repeat protein
VPVEDGEGGRLDFRHSFQSGEHNFWSISMRVNVILLYILLSAALACADDFAERFRAYQKASEAGRAAFDRKEYPAVITQYTKVIEVSPFEATSYFRRGVALLKSGKAKEALADLDRALLIDPRQTQAISYRGMCHERLGEYMAALKDYTDALTLNPKDPALHNNLAWLYATAGDEKVRDPAKAVEYAKKAAELSGENNAEILDTLARAYFVTGRKDEAVEAEKKALKLAPGNEGYNKSLQEYEGAKP